MPDPEPKIVLLAGATGLVGKNALDTLLDAPDIGRVFAVTRRPLGREHPRLANRIVKFDTLEAQLQGTTCHVAVCCLGTTIHQAGSQPAFRRVDVDYVLAFARAAKAGRHSASWSCRPPERMRNRKTFTCVRKGRWKRQWPMSVSYRSTSCNRDHYWVGAARCELWSSGRCWPCPS
jgi:hypothetical protein